MGPVRRVIVTIISLAMIAGGGYFLILELFYSDHIFWRVLIAAAFVMSMGFLLLWDGILRPPRAPARP
jgi:hypothetical protein